MGLEGEDCWVGLADMCGRDMGNGVPSQCGAGLGWGERGRWYPATPPEQEE